MEVVSKVTIKEQIYNLIKKRIQLEQYKPGERLNIDSIAKELNVSNSPIREALSMLEKDGVVTTSPNAGTRVVSLNEEETLELNQTIYIMLSGAYEVCIGLGKEAELESLLRNRIEVQQRLLREHEDISYIHAAIRFDQSFLQATGNSYISKVFEKIADVFFLVVAERFRNQTVNHHNNLREHEQILEAVSRRDHKVVRRLLAEHYEQSELLS